MSDYSGFFNKVYEVVKAVPKGKVVNYGTVALICGNPRMSRQVGFALHVNPDQKNIPCHRVVFKDGSLSPSFAFGGANAQYELLKNEGVTFEDNKVDKQCFAEISSLLQALNR